MKKNLFDSNNRKLTCHDALETAGHSCRARLAFDWDSDSVIVFDSKFHVRFVGLVGGGGGWRVCKWGTSKLTLCVRRLSSQIKNVSNKRLLCLRLLLPALEYSILCCALNTCPAQILLVVVAVVAHVVAWYQWFFSEEGSVGEGREAARMRHFF